MSCDKSILIYFNLSFSLFFAMFVVVAVVVFQGLMIALGDFSAYNNTEVCINKCRSAFSWKDGWN